MSREVREQTFLAPQFCAGHIKKKNLKLEAFLRLKKGDIVFFFDLQVRNNFGIT